MIAIQLIQQERERQIIKEHYSTGHDDRHTRGTIAIAAAKYALPAGRRDVLKYPSKWRFKPSPDDRIRELVKAGALIVAEIERLQRKQQRRSKRAKMGVQHAG